MPAQAKKKTSQSVMTGMEADEEETEQQAVSQTFECVGSVGTLIQACSVELEIEVSIFRNDRVLR